MIFSNKKRDKVAKKRFGKGCLYTRSNNKAGVNSYWSCLLYTSWNDIRRWHIAAAALQKQIGTPIYIAGNPATNKAQNGGYASRYNTSAGFMKIPESQISLSSELQQNEGWGADAEYNGWTN